MPTLTVSNQLAHIISTKQKVSLYAIKGLPKCFEKSRTMRKKLKEKTTEKQLANFALLATLYFYEILVTRHQGLVC